MAARICPRCGRENPEENGFCISCGAPLARPEAEQAVASAQGPAAVQPQPLEAEVRRLSGEMARMNDRLAALERLQGITVPPRQPAPVATAQAGPPPSAPVGIEEPPSPLGADVFDRVVQWDWEQILGGNWLARVGVLALVIGAAFFLKLAFDNQWIGPNGRVALGILGGLAMLGAGEYWRDRYRAYARALSGGGIALLYLSIFAAFTIFDLIGLYPAIAFLLLISVASAGLALRYDSMALAIIGILGAFAAPFILGGLGSGGRGVGDDTGQGGIQLMTYVLIVALGVVALSTFRNWRWFTLLGLIGAITAFEAWFGEFGDDTSLLVSQGSLTIIFLIFVGATTLFHLVWRRAPQTFDQSLMVLNAAAYFTISYALLWEDFRPWLGGFSLLLVLFYAGLAYLALRRSPENAHLSFFALGIALVFLTIAVPVQLGNRAWTTIAWATEGTVLIWLSFRLGMPNVRAIGYIVFAIAGGRLLFFDTPVDLRTFTLVLNERFLAFTVGIAAAYLAAYLLWREREALQEWERNATSVYPVFVVAANFLSLWLLSVEAIAYFDSRLEGLSPFNRFGAKGRNFTNALNLSLTAIWALYAVVLLVMGIARRSRAIRLAGLGLLAIPVAKVFVYDVFALERAYRIGAFMGLGTLLLAGGYLYQRYSTAIKGFLAEK